MQEMRDSPSEKCAGGEVASNIHISVCLLVPEAKVADGALRRVPEAIILTIELRGSDLSRD